MFELLALLFVIGIFALVRLDTRDLQEYGDRSKHRQNSQEHEDLCQ